MRKREFIWRLGVALLSVVFLFALGMIGEYVINLLWSYQHSAHLPELSAFFANNYLINKGYFVFSMTPFMVIHLALPFLGLWRSYWYAFTSTWLIALIYFSSLVMALTLPQILLVSVAGENSVPTIICVIDVSLALAFATFCLWKSVKKNKKEKLR